MLHQFLPRS